MELTTKLAWGALILVHASPAAVLFDPTLVRKLYGFDGQDVLGVLLVHRGALFLALICACAFALFDPAVRRAASVIVAVSVVGFLVVYVRAGMPVGALRTVAIIDLVALVPLLWVLISAWRPQAA